MAWEGLLRQRNIVFLGEAGCGKSELAVHLALELAGQGREVHFFDLDQTKPLMRSRDAEGLLERAGITVHFEQQCADAPTQVGGIVPLLLDEDKTVILDVGGNDTGAKLIGGYAHLLKTSDVWFVVRASRLKMPRFLLNPNLGGGTTLAEYLDGVRQGLELLSPYVAVEAAAVPAGLYEQAKAETALPLIPITSHISVPEAGLE